MPILILGMNYSMAAMWQQNILSLQAVSSLQRKIFPNGSFGKIFNAFPLFLSIFMANFVLFYMQKI